MSRVTRGTPSGDAYLDLQNEASTLRPLAEVLDGFAPLAQDRWSQWRRRSNSSHLPEQFEPVLRIVIEFADPVITGVANGLVWDPEAAAWR